MSLDPERALQRALLTKLRGNGDLTALLYFQGYRQADFVID